MTDPLQHVYDAYDLAAWNNEVARDEVIDLTDEGDER